MNIHQTHPPITLVGHRGAAHEAPENTVAGFRHALTLGLRAIEFDVRLTADDHLAVIHDATVDRTTNRTGAVADLTMAQLSRLDARAIHQTWPEPCPVPSLSEILDILTVVPQLLIEIKPDTPARVARVAEQLFETLDRAGRTAGIVVIAGKPEFLLPIKAQRPEIPLGVGIDGTDESWAEGEQLGITYALVNANIATPEVALGLRERQWAGVVGPVNDLAVAARVRELGFSHPYSDAPSTVAPLFMETFTSI